MSRPPKAEISKRVDVYLPESLHNRLTLLLWSTAEQRVPHGAWSQFFETLARSSLERLAQAQPQESL